MKSPLYTLFLCMLIGAAGCVSVPQRSVDDLALSIPDAWPSLTPAQTSSQPWIESFDDPQLPELVAQALENNRDLRAAAARVEAARAQSRIAGADRYPTVGADISASRQRQNFIGFPIPGGGTVLSTTSTRISSGVNVSWEPDLWGRIKSGRMAALAEQQAIEEELAAARLSLAAQTARAWFGHVEASMQERLARQTVEAYEFTLGSVQKRYELGLAPPLDLRLLRTQLSEARALAAQREIQRKQAGITLELLLGRFPTARNASTESLPTVPAPVPAGLPAQAIARRPDLRAAERRLAAADARWAQARASLYPSLRLTGSAGTASDELGQLLDGDFRVWSLLAGLAQPIFQGGKLRANVDLAEAGSRQALEAFASQVLQAFAEVQAALAIDGALVEREAALQDSLKEANAARGLAESQYRSGLVDILTVLESRRRSLAAESQLIAVHATRLNNRIDLYLALGGDTALPQSETRIAPTPVVRAAP